VQSFIRKYPHFHRQLIFILIFIHAHLVSSTPAASLYDLSDHFGISFISRFLWFVLGLSRKWQDGISNSAKISSVHVPSSSLFATL